MVRNRTHVIMATIRIPNGFITLADTDFKCPHCDKQYNDTDDVYLNKTIKNKSGCTSIKCECENTFMMTYDITGKAVSFIKSEKL